MFKKILIHCGYVQLDSVTSPALISHSFPLVWDVFCRRLFQKSAKRSENDIQISIVSLSINNDTVFCLSSWESGISLDIFHTTGKTFSASKKTTYTKASSDRCWKVEIVALTLERTKQRLYFCRTNRRTGSKKRDIQGDDIEIKHCTSMTYLGCILLKS